ncbi:MAG: glycosyltransferase family 2 protein, partial [Candidatus Dojkabacteria bacterium]
MRLAIVTVSFNTEKVLYRSLESFYKTLPTYMATDIDYFVLDNGSEDHTLEMLKRDFPQVKIIEYGENLGFGEAHNKFFAKHIDDYEFFLLANPDLRFEQGWLSELLDQMRSNKKLAALNPLIFYDDEFFPISLEIRGRDVFLHHKDYRFLADPVGRENVITQEREISGMRFVKVPPGRYFAYLDVKEKKVELNIYNMSLDPYALKLDRYEIKQGIVHSLLKKILFKLGIINEGVKFKHLEIKLEKIFGYRRTPSPVRIINSFGARIRAGEELPDNNYFGQQLEQTNFEPEKAEFFHGACVLLRAEALMQILNEEGYIFDPDFFMFLEESDLSRRLRG